MCVCGGWGVTVCVRRTASQDPWLHFPFLNTHTHTHTIILGGHIFPRKLRNT